MITEAALIFDCPMQSKAMLTNRPMLWVNCQVFSEEIRKRKNQNQNPSKNPRSRKEVGHGDARWPGIQLTPEECANFLRKFYACGQIRK